MASTKGTGSKPADTKAAAQKQTGSKSSGNGNGAGKSKAAAQAGKAEGSGKGNTQLAKFFEDSLKDIYWAEKHLTKALPKMHKAATTDELKAAIEEHTTQTEGHIKRLEQVFELIGKKAVAKKCDAMEGLVKEGESIVEETEDGTMTRDVGIIMASQKIEHYEIATYGGLVSLANTMGLEEAAGLLTETLEEEKETDQNLSDIAENNINWAAEEEEEDTEADEKD